MDCRVAESHGSPTKASPLIIKLRHYRYSICPEPAIAYLATYSDDPKIWDALEKAVRRSSLGMRMELLSKFGDSKNLRWRVERLRLLAAFLDDHEVRDVRSDERLKSGAAYQYEVISVRDFVALELGSMLKINVPNDPKRTAEEWTKIRENVRAALKRELEKKP
jgi:hypothetical protein